MQLEQFHEVDPSWPSDGQAALEHFHRWHHLRELHGLYEQTPTLFRDFAMKLPQSLGGYTVEDIVEGVPDLPVVAGVEESDEDNHEEEEQEEEEEEEEVPPLSFDNPFWWRTTTPFEDEEEEDDFGEDEVAESDDVRSPTPFVPPPSRPRSRSPHRSDLRSLV